MNLQGLTQMIQANQTKTASTKESATSPSGVMSAIDEALAQAEQTKTASAASNAPRTDLEKMASEVALGNRDAEVEHVQKLGAAMADSFVRELAAYETAAEKLAMEKAASERITADEIELVRFARANPEAFIAKVAENAQGSEPELTEKQAAELWDQTAQETVRAIHKTAMAHYAIGYQTIVKALQG